MSALVARIEGWLYAPSSGVALGAFRVLFAAYLLVHFSTMLPHVEVLFSRHGVYVPYLTPDLAPSPALAWVLFAAMSIAAGLLLVGWRTAWVAPALLALYAHHYLLQLAVKQSTFERLILIELAVLSVAGTGGTLAITRRATSRAAGWAERMIAAQCIFLYVGAGLWKALNPAWHDGALLRSTLQGMWATPLAFELVQHASGLEVFRVASWLVVLLELALGVLLIVRRTRWLGVLLATGFHLTNCVLLFLPEFLVCVVALVVFLDEVLLLRTTEAVRRAVRRLVRSSRASAA